MTNINTERKYPKGPQFTESLTPTATVGYTRGLAVGYGSDEFHATLIALAGIAILGLIAEDAVAGLPLLVVEFGQTVAQIGATVAAGQQLAVNAAGQLVPAQAGQMVVAIALDANPNAGDYISVFVLGPASYPMGGSLVAYYVAAGAIPVQSGTAVLNGAAAIEMALATPTTPAQDGTVITIVALTAHAHTVTTAADIINGTKDTVTFAAVADVVELEAIGGKWIVRSIGGPTPAALSEV
jgi:hypothetical protein